MALRDLLWQLATAFVGSLGFSILFHIRGGKLPVAALGGLLCWGFYLLVGRTLPVLVASLLAGCFAAAYGELMARLFRAPATLFVTPAVIPLVPGGSLYNFMYRVLSGDVAGAAPYGYETVNVALGVAIGIAVVTSLCNLLTLLHRRRTP